MYKQESPIITILILSANPKGEYYLRLEEERRDIEERLKLSKQSHQFNLVKMDAVRPRDILQAMLDINPQIVHFCGHGIENKGLVFEDETGKKKLVDGEAIAELFNLFVDTLECVVLNACYSEDQANAIVQYIPYVVGMSQAVGDQAAIEFAVGFYSALGAGRDIDFAFKTGCNAIRLAGIAEYSTPVIKKKPKLETKIDQKKDSTEVKSVKITSFEDEDQILSLPNEEMPVKREIVGEIVGFSDNELEELELLVEVEIKTDIWYLQGLCRVDKNKMWKIKGRFSGGTNTIKAELKDKNKNRIDVAIITVSVIE